MCVLWDLSASTHRPPSSCELHTYFGEDAELRRHGCKTGLLPAGEAELRV